MTIDMPPDLHTWMQEIERRLRVQETAARVPQITSGGVGAASSSTPLGVSLTTSYVEVSGGQSVTFNATPQGAAIVIAFVNHTLEVSAGKPTVWLAPNISGVAAADANALTISSSVSPWTETAVSVAYFSGLAQGEHTAVLSAKRGASGSILTYTLNSQSIVVIPL